MKTLFRGVAFGIMLSILTLCSASAGHAEDPSPEVAQRIVAAMLKAYGGMDAVAGVRTVLARGEIADFMNGQQGRYLRCYQRPGKLRIEIMPELGGEVRVLEDGKGWQGTAAALHEARPIAVRSMIYQYSYLDLPMGFAHGTYRVSYAGIRDLGGKPMDLLVIEPKDAPAIRIFLDRSSHLIRRVAADFDMGMGSSELATEYEDFRPVGKVLFPFRLNNFAGDMQISTITLSGMEINGKIPPGYFPPFKQEGGQ